MNGSRLMRSALCPAALFLYACNGEVSNPTENYNALLSGSFQVHQVSDASANSVTDTARVDVTADGAGAGTTIIAPGNHSGGATGSGVFSYAVAADRTFSIATSNGTVYGIVAANGSPFVITDTNRTVSAVPPLEDAGTVMAVGVKKSSGLTNAAVTGNYQIHQVGDGNAGAGLYTSRVDIAADGAGAGTWSIASHSAGSAGNGLFIYTVAPDGTFSITTQDATGAMTIGTDHGIVSADGSLFIVTDTNPTASAVPPVEDAEIVMAVGVKKSSGLTNAVLNGNYRIHQVGKGISGRYTSRVNITADGAGAGTWSIASHSAGDVGNGLFTYAVAPDGTFSATVKDATGAMTIGTDYGIVSADGNLFIVSDTNPTASAVPPVEDAEIIMAVGMRR